MLSSSEISRIVWLWQISQETNSMHRTRKNWLVQWPDGYPLLSFKSSAAATATWQRVFVSEARCGQPGQVQACSLVLCTGRLRQDVVGNWTYVLSVAGMVWCRMALGLLLFPRNDRTRDLDNPASHINLLPSWLHSRRMCPPSYWSGRDNIG